MTPVVISHGLNRELAPLIGALAALGYDVFECRSAFETLQFMAVERVAALVSLASLPDLNGYQLACLVKSIESTKMLPIIVVNLHTDATDVNSSPSVPMVHDFAALANRCRIVVEVADSPQALKTLQTLLPRTQPTSRTLAGTFSKAKKSANRIRTQNKRRNAENLLRGTYNILDELLIEKVVSDRVISLLCAIESRSTFAEHFFEVTKQLVNCSICGLLLVCTAKPWGALNISTHHYKKEGLQQWLKSIGGHNLDGLDIDFDVSGRLYEQGDPLPDLAVFEVKMAENILGMLFFAPTQPSGFDKLSLRTISCLQEKMAPIMQLRSDRERLADKERFPIVTDELTGTYNLDFLIGFMQQQLLFSFRQRTPLSLVLLQVDGIREVNSKIGWEAGDHLLMQIGMWLANHTRGSDVVARCGGNTFAVVLPNTNLDGARVVANKSAEKLKGLEPINNVLPLKIYTGCAAAVPSELNPEVLLCAAQADLKAQVTNTI
jgi:diguanylate cyclase (GGDEF)-like protein